MPSVALAKCTQHFIGKQFSLDTKAIWLRKVLICFWAEPKLNDTVFSWPCISRMTASLSLTERQAVARHCASSFSKRSICSCCCCFVWSARSFVRAMIFAYSQRSVSRSSLTFCSSSHSKSRWRCISSIATLVCFNSTVHFANCGRQSSTFSWTSRVFMLRNSLQMIAILAAISSFSLVTAATLFLSGTALRQIVSWYPKTALTLPYFWYLH